MAYFEYSSLDSTSILVRFRELSEAPSAYKYLHVDFWNAYNGSDSREYNIPNSSVSFSTDGTGYYKSSWITFDDLIPGSTYHIRCFVTTNALWDVDYSTGASYAVINTPLPLAPLVAPTISLSTKTTTSVTLTVYTQYAEDYETQYRDNITYTWTNFWGDIYNPIVVTGLVSGRTYDFRVRATRGTEVSSYSSILTVDIGVPRPTNWTWEYTITSGQPFYTQSGSTVFIMRATHWNAFIARIDEFRVYKGLATYSFTTAVTTHTPAQIRSCINQAIAAINAMGFSQSSVSTDGNVAASTFITMRNNLNSIV